MKTLKKVLAASTALLLSLGIVACGNNESKDPDKDTANQQQEEETSGDEVHLKWALWDLETTAYWKEMANAFEKENENVKIEMVDLGSTDYMTVLTTQLSGKNSEFDIITIKDIPGYANLLSLAALEPLHDMMDEPNINADDFGGIVDQITSDGKVYGLPFRSDFWVIFYNKDLFDEAGVDYPTNDMTFEEYDALARKMTSGEGNEKVYGAHYHTWRSAVQLFGILDGKHTIIDGEYDFLEPYYEMVLDQQKDGICQDYAMLKTGKIHYSGVFQNNQAAMMNMGSWFISTMQTYNIENPDQAVNFGIVKYPHAEGIEPGTTLGTITSLGINSNSEHKKEAADFIDWAVSEEGAKVIAETGTFPARSSAEISEILSSSEGFPADENSIDALETYKVYLEMPMHPKSADIETALNNSHDNIMTENISIEDGLAEMTRDVQDVLK